MQMLMLISSILLLSFWSIGAIPTVPHWVGDDDIEDIIKHQESTPVELSTLPTDVPTPPPEGCPTTNGSVAVGTAYTDGACKHCRCIDNGLSECFTIKCPRIECVDYVYIERKCCPVCVNGPNCRMPDGTILQKGKKMQQVDMSCECVDMVNSWEEPVAECKVI